MTSTIEENYKEAFRQLDSSQADFDDTKAYTGKKYKWQALNSAISAVRDTEVELTKLERKLNEEIMKLQ